MKLNQELIATAALGLTLGGSGHKAQPQGGEQSAVECFNPKSFKGGNSCGLSQEQIDAANAKFASQFAKMKPYDCGGKFSSFPLKSGELAWVNKPNAKECFNDGGFLIEKDEKSGKLVVKTK